MLAVAAPLQSKEWQHIADNFPVLISLNDACALTSLSRTAINRWRALGMFPAAVPLGDKRVAFVRSEVEQWVRDRIAARAKAEAA